MSLLLLYKFLNSNLGHLISIAGAFGNLIFSHNIIIKSHYVTNLRKTLFEIFIHMCLTINKLYIHYQVQKQKMLKYTENYEISKCLNSFTQKRTYLCLKAFKGCSEDCLHCYSLEAGQTDGLNQ